MKFTQSINPRIQGLKQTKILLNRLLCEIYPKAKTWDSGFDIGLRRCTWLWKHKLPLFDELKTEAQILLNGIKYCDSELSQIAKNKN